MNDKNELLKCPYCGGEPVIATVVTMYSFVSEHRVCKDGIDMEDKGNAMYNILGTMHPEEPTIRANKFKCTSCGKEWNALRKNEYKLVTDENGNCYFERG